MNTSFQFNFKKGVEENLFLSGLQDAKKSMQKMHNMRERQLENEIFKVTADKFNELSAKIFSYQRQNCAVYSKWVDLIKMEPNKIPFLPIGLFKDHRILGNGQPVEAQFESSSTTGLGVSRHFVPYLDFYQRNFEAGFKEFYGEPSDYCILALLPSYLERDGSSLVWMFEKLMEKGAPNSGFYLHDHTNLLIQLVKNEAIRQKTLLLGVTYAILDLAQVYRGQELHSTIIMETGGMKGKRAELTKEEVHKILVASFGTKKIHSEYGMTELMSQAYSDGDGIFRCPPWMQIHIMDINDPGMSLPCGKTGRICIIDLGNLYSCSFIATDDLGKLHPDGSFEILGRLDYTDMRGCNLMVG